ncbi:MAG: glutamate--tRNA ligase [SAR202 cluster bacterium]|nr:MAG: glutamate--tRNA ligase [SAR202 cluster bacterium]MCH2318410.1 glutamate--tRNA ligase [SAR202 cluster bacterium]MQG74128.1 glutamate--tRNA ligase [SAR202 cluster bacterium]
MPETKVRVRYAPSPTGEPHVGNIRTALFDWLFARNKGGDFIVRVEDTDQARRVEGAIELQKESLQWLGLDWDEGLGEKGESGPYVQSERLDYYENAVSRLLTIGAAYKCFCTSERLESLRQIQKQQKLSRLGYDGKCRSLKKEKLQKMESESIPFVVRFLMPDEGISQIDDLVRGIIEFDNDLVEDFVILKADGFPTYHLASVVDDHHMGITHVFRGEEWVSSIPRHVQIYRAFDWETPIYAHLPTILAPDKTKLSKRHGATSVLEYKERGYLPDAVVNFLSLLGWSLDGETEIISRDDLVGHFNPLRINAAGAVFDIEKLDWMNGYYIRELSAEELGSELLGFWTQFPPNEFDMIPTLENAVEVARLVRERLKTLSDAAPLVSFIFKNEIVYTPEELIQKGMNDQQTHNLLIKVREIISLRDIVTADEIESDLRKLAGDLDVKVGQLLGTIRLATSGQRVSPPLFGSLEILGRDRVVVLLDKAIEMLTGDSKS